MPNKINKKDYIIIYEPKKGYIRIATRIADETIWLTQGQIAAAFDTQRPAITKHLDHIFKTGELKESAVSSKIELTAKDGKKYIVKVYSLDAIISVGYRVNSKRATEFRIWAKNVLKQHIIEGYTLNENRLKESDEKIKKLQDTLATIEETNAKLKKSSSLKNEFVSLATHQIRGPLGAIKGYVSLLMEGDYGNVPKEFVEPLDIIFKSTDSLSKTVSDFLDISRIEQGEMRYYMKNFDMRDLVKEVSNEMKAGIEKDGLEMRLNITASACPVHDDKTKLKQVLINLVDNAHKYTKTGWIEIGLTRTDSDKVLFSVKDSGVGVSKDTMPLLFQKFSRAKDAGHANILGTGLGLYVAKKMLEAQNGRIWAESTGEGKGAEFYVELGLAK